MTSENITIKPVPLEFKQLLLFTTSIEEINERGKLTSLTFEREVEIFHTSRADGQFKFQVFLDEASYIFDRAYEPYHELLKKTSMVFDELILWANAQGNLTKIHNLPFVQYRWEIIREELIPEYEGDIFEQHVAFLDELLADHDQVLRYLSTPAMYGLYFNGCWGTYEMGKAVSCTMPYGNDLQNITVAENIKMLPTNNALKMQLTNGATKEMDNIYSYNGSYTYYNNVLDNAEKTIGLNPNKTINYSIKCIGLKSIIP